MKPAFVAPLLLFCLVHPFLVSACDAGRAASNGPVLAVSTDTTEPKPSPAPSGSSEHCEDASSSCVPPAAFVEPRVVSNALPEYRVVREGCDEFQPPVVRFVVTTNGTTRSAKIIRSTGCERSDAIILDYIRGWTYEPATCDGEPVAQVTLLTVRWGT